MLSGDNFRITRSEKNKQTCCWSFLYLQYKSSKSEFLLEASSSVARAGPDPGDSALEREKMEC